MTKYNGISITRGRESWRVVVDTSAKEWITHIEYGYTGTAIDAQYTSADSACIDPDGTSYDIPGVEHFGSQTAIFNGSLECVPIDEPGWVFRYDSYIIFVIKIIYLFFVIKK